jgi:GNAT superfamily N-acetyltransferase
MSGGTVIRGVRQDDYTQWRVLWDGYNSFYGREGKTALSDAVINMTWSRFFDRYEPMDAFVAERARGSGIGAALIAEVYRYAWCIENCFNASQVVISETLAPLRHS